MFSSVGVYFSHCLMYRTKGLFNNLRSFGFPIKELEVFPWVGFGDFSNQHGLVKRRPLAPIKRLKGQLHKFCKVVDIDEYGTSQTCSECSNRVELYKNHIRRKKNGVLEPTARMSNVFSVIRCKNNECKLCLMDRDINAARNILGLLVLQYLGQERPACFSRRRH